MNEKLRKKIALVVISICVAVLAGFGFYETNKDKTTEEIIQNTVEEVKQVIISNETQETANKTIEATQKNEDLSTNEIIKSSETEEETVTDEGALETDAFLEQENISYNGDNSTKGKDLLGAYQGLTYYSQADSRWANMPYTSTGNYTQTMKSSACGPTSAAMVVSSSKGTILPTTMANLAVDNGYRTANNGTAWAYYSFIADYFDFKEYHTSNDFYTAMDYLKQDKDNDGQADYYIVASCNSGLFTTGGHYIVLVANNSGTITVYDPYLYSRKI